LYYISVIPSERRYLASTKCIIKKIDDQDVSIVGTRSGRVGILVTLMLMLSVIMFVGTLFWLITDTSLIVANPGSSLFKGCMVVFYAKEYTGGYEQVSYEVFIQEAVAARIAFRVNNLENETVLLVEAQGKTLEWVPEG
jgi:hypothetical protein